MQVSDIFNIVLGVLNVMLSAIFLGLVWMECWRKRHRSTTELDLDAD
jgi:hypothetical protein